MTTPEVVFAGTGGGAVTEIADYEAGGGFSGLARARAMTPAEVVDELNASGLRGRGGAFFPTGRKWSFLPSREQVPRPHYLVVNADESEPGTFKDREIMLRVPFRFLEGCLIAAHAIESQHVFVYIRGEYEREFEVLVDALEQMRKKRLLGKVTIVVHRGAGAYICGEETALLESLEGKRGQPRTKPPFPAIAGLYASPTAVNNVESITTATPILEMGGAEYAKLGVESSTGTRVFSLSGDVERGGNYELPHGFPLRDLIFEVGGGIAGGRSLKAVIPGGSSTPILTADEVERVTLDFDSMTAAGSAIGSAAVIALDDRCCMVQLAVRVSQFYEHESCGKCTPCRVGTKWLTQILQKIEDGSGTQGDLDLLLDVAERINGKCLCPLGDSDAIAVGSYVAKFRDEFQAHIDGGGCPLEGASSLEGVLAPVTVHERHVHAHGVGRAIERPLGMLGVTDLVTVVIDDREVQVPKGTGLVETAASAGIEIPVFCYEPRLGPAVGACRMCLVDVEGLPKLQAGCTLSAQDGMVVRTAATSPKAADGQNATLEFILVNHPLDCPVCDKGGECPLQDLTFRYGPGSTRMSFPKLTFEKPIPISPLIALDRERCILCYRCTRFSSDVAEDDQLVARNRGAFTEIATFADDPYAAPFSGNVVELCPVGALTSTQYRFRARPWEIQNVPTVCGLCPVGCNVSATTREGKVLRVLSRNHPEVDGGWICDKGRFAHPHLTAGDRIVEPLLRGEEGLRPATWDDALDTFERLLRSAEGHVVTALSGSETIEQAYALARLMRVGAGANSAVLPESTSNALDAFRAPLSVIADAELVVVVGDAAVVDRAPLVDLWLKQARRGGAEIVTIGPAGSVPAQPGGAAAALEGLCRDGDALGRRLEASDRAVLIWSGSGGGGGARLAEAAHALGFEGKPGCGAFHLPATPNGRAVAQAWAAAADTDEPDPGHIRLLVVSGDEAAASPAVRDLAERADAVVAVALFHELAVGWADVVLPATAMLERDGTIMSLEGRVQRVRRAVLPPVPDELAWTAKLAQRFGVDVSPHAAVLFEEAAGRMFAGLDLVAIGERAPLPARAPWTAPEPVTTEPQAAAAAAENGGPLLGELRLLRYRPLFSGPEVERVRELQFQRPGREAAISPDDAERRGIATGDAVTLRSNGTSVELRARIDRRLVAGVVRVADEHAAGLHQAVEVVKA